MKFIKFITIFSFVLIGCISIFKKVEAQGDLTSQSILFVEDGCPYCDKTKTFIDENGIDDIEFLDIREDPQNADFYNTVCDNAGISLYDRGVPMFYDNGEVITSADKIITYIGEKYGIEVSDDPLSTNENHSNRIVFIILGFGLISSLLFLVLNRNK